MDYLINTFTITANLYNEDALKKQKSAIEEWEDFKERWTSTSGGVTFSLFNLSKL